MDRQKVRRGDKIIQIHHISKSDHWLVSAYYRTGTVVIYDSMDNRRERLELNEDFRRQLVEMYGHLADRRTDEFTVHLFTMPCQEDDRDCGPFSAAYVVEVIMNGRPET